ncbi:acyl transferase/acyl hydrolase/lysophospholipase, partial [Rhizoctonia solani]
GGEAKGLSSLLILQDIMNRLKGSTGTTPQPWEHFDLIAGSGTGAISAIMLGRLRMNIDDAISAYIKLISNVFSDKKFLANGPAAYSTTKLEQELKEIVRKATGDEDERMMEKNSGQVRCRVVVYAMHAHNMNAVLPCAFRTYPSGAYAMPDCRIWEAVRASTANPHLFKSIEILNRELGIKQPYIGGGIGYSNPTGHLLKEAAATFPDQPVASITSIGTGYTHTIRLPAPRLYTHGHITHNSVLELAHMIAMDNQRVAQEMANYFSDTLDLYFRFEVGQGMQGIEATESGKQGEIASHVYAYISDPDVDRRLNSLVITIRERPANFKTSHISKVTPTPPRIATFTNLPPPTYFFTGRDIEVDMVCGYFSNAEAPQVFVLHGMGGAGKTQIALKAMERIASIFEGMLIIDGSSRATIEAALSDFAVSKYTGDTYMDALTWIKNRERRWLLLFDNVDDPKVSLPEYFPRGANYSVLITTRYRSFAPLAKGENAACNISDMRLADARRLLLVTSGLKLNELSELETNTADQLLQVSTSSLCMNYAS